MVFLLIPQPDGSLRELPVTADMLVLGRAEDCDVVIAGRLISRQHARLRREGHVYLIEDLESRNGTFLNGEPLREPAPLHDGDRIDLGGSTVVIFADGDATSTRPYAPAQGIWIDVDAQDVWVDGRRVSPPLSPAQFTLLQLLLARADQVCSRAEIIDAVWPEASGGVSDEALDALIKRTRARLSETSPGQRYLVSLRGRGLVLRLRPA
jgi:DNA-binding response OmpR family regulator